MIAPILIIGILIVASGAIASILAVLSVLGLFVAIVRPRTPSVSTDVSDRVARLVAAHPVHRTVDSLLQALEEGFSELWPSLEPIPDARIGAPIEAGTDATAHGEIALPALAGASRAQAAEATATVHFELALLALQRGDWPTALTCSERGLQAVASHALLRCALGVALEGSGQARDALACFEAAAAAESSSAAHQVLATDLAQALRRELGARPKSTAPYR